MAKADILVPFIRRWEGGFSHDPADAGGATNKGVTIETYRHFFGANKTVDDLKRMSDEDWMYIFRVGYWNRWQADQIIGQKVANILVDWVWASGKYGITIPQRLIGVTQDGIVGPQTIAAVNKYTSEVLFSALFEAREIYIRDIVAKSVAAFEKKVGRKATAMELLRHTNKRFEQGWMNRLNALKDLR